MVKLTIVVSTHVQISFLTLFRLGGGEAKRPPTSFSPVTSTNVEFTGEAFLPH